MTSAKKQSNNKIYKLQSGFKIMGGGNGREHAFQVVEPAKETYSSESEVILLNDIRDEISRNLRQPILIERTYKVTTKQQSDFGAVSPGFPEKATEYEFGIITGIDLVIPRTYQPAPQLVTEFGRGIDANRIVIAHIPVEKHFRVNQVYRQQRLENVMQQVIDWKKTFIGLEGFILLTGTEPIVDFLTSKYPENGKKLFDYFTKTH